MMQSLAIGYYNVAGVRPAMAANRCGVIYGVNRSTFNEFILAKMRQLNNTSIVDFGSMLCARKHKFICINRNRMNHWVLLCRSADNSEFGVHANHSYRTEPDVKYICIAPCRRWVIVPPHAADKQKAKETARFAIGENWFYRLFMIDRPIMSNVDSAVGILRQIKIHSDSTKRQMIS